MTIALNIVQTAQETLDAATLAAPVARLDDYDSACARAATRQGLDPLTNALGFAGVEYAVEQTGGFCMVVTVTTDAGTYAVINDGPDDDRPWLLGFYRGDAWTECGESETDTTHTLDDVVSILADVTGRA